MEIDREKTEDVGGRERDRDKERNRVKGREIKHVNEKKSPAGDMDNAYVTKW